MHRPSDFTLLLAAGLPLACASTVDDAATSGSHDDEVNDAIAACGPFAEKVSTCYAAEGGESGGEVADYYLVMLGYCISNFGYYADQAACQAALEDYYACIATVECDEVFGDDDVSADSGDSSGGESGAEMPGPCDDEADRIDAECDDDEE